MKRNLKKYYQPTPVIYRKIGDSLLAISTMGVPAILMDYKYIGITMFLFGVIGKFLSNFFTENNTEQ